MLTNHGPLSAWFRRRDGFYIYALPIRAGNHTGINAERSSYSEKEQVSVLETELILRNKAVSREKRVMEKNTYYTSIVLRFSCS